MQKTFELKCCFLLSIVGLCHMCIETFPIDKTKRYVDSINARTRREKPLPLSSSTVLV